MKHLTPVIRGILTVALCYAVYTETGVWTALAIALISINAEMTAALIKNHRLQFDILRRYVFSTEAKADSAQIPLLKEIRHDL